MYFKVVPEDPIVLTEGGDVHNLTVYSSLPHTLYCLDMSQLNTPIGTQKHYLLFNLL